jgi:hypothetical protein
MSSLDASIRGLLKVISQIQNVYSAKDGSFLGGSSKPYWHICIEKFHAAYIKAKNPDGFRDMFHSFFSKHREKFVKSVIDEEGDINDEWLKNKEVLSMTSRKKKSSDEGVFSLKNINCRGEVIYFDETNEKIKNVSIPISEAYLTACKIYSDGAKRGEYSPLPAQLLVALFTLMSDVCEDKYKEGVSDNVKELKDVVEQLTNGEEETTTGSTLDGLGSILKKAQQSLNLNLGDINSSNIEEKVSSILDPNITGKFKTMWNRFNEKVNLQQGADLGSIITNVSDAMKDKDLQNELQSTIAEVASKVGFGEIKFSKEDEQVISSNTGDVTEQE